VLAAMMDRFEINTSSLGVSAEELGEPYDMVPFTGLHHDWSETFHFFCQCQTSHDSRRTHKEMTRVRSFSTLTAVALLVGSIAPDRHGVKTQPGTASSLYSSELFTDLLPEQ
jgi:hypothetical protein